MNQEYKFKYRRWFLWRSVVAIGHKYHPEMDRMDVFLKNGGILSIACWSKYDLKLSIDWVLATKTAMEKEAGQKIELNV